MSDKNRKSESQLKAEAEAMPKVYGPVRFGIPATRKVSDKYGQVSVKMLDTFVPIIGTGLVVISAIYANLERKGDTVSVIPNAYLPAKVLKPELEGASDAFLAHVEQAALDYAGYDAAYAESARLLLGHADPAAAAQVAVPKVNRPVMARLIGKDGAVVKVAPVAAGAQPSA